MMGSRVRVTQAAPPIFPICGNNLSRFSKGVLMPIDPTVRQVRRIAAEPKRADWPLTSALTSARFSDPLIAGTSCRCIAAPMGRSGGVEQTALLGPVERDLSHPEQLSAGKRWRMTPVENGSKEMGRKP